jgi:hypothetical protein
MARSANRPQSKAVVAYPGGPLLVHHPDGDTVPAPFAHMVQEAAARRHSLFSPSARSFIRGWTA